MDELSKLLKRILGDSDIIKTHDETDCCSHNCSYEKIIKKGNNRYTISKYYIDVSIKIKKIEDELMESILIYIPNVLGEIVLEYIKREVEGFVKIIKNRINNESQLKKQKRSYKYNIEINKWKFEIDDDNRKKNNGNCDIRRKNRRYENKKVFKCC